MDLAAARAPLCDGCRASTACAGSTAPAPARETSTWAAHGQPAGARSTRTRCTRAAPHARQQTWLAIPVTVRTGGARTFEHQQRTRHTGGLLQRACCQRFAAAWRRCVAGVRGRWPPGLGLRQLRMGQGASRTCGLGGVGYGTTASGGGGSRVRTPPGGACPAVCPPPPDGPGARPPAGWPAAARRCHPMTVGRPGWARAARRHCHPITVSRHSAPA